MSCLCVCEASSCRRVCSAEAAKSCTFFSSAELAKFSFPVQFVRELNSPKEMNDFHKTTRGIPGRDPLFELLRLSSVYPVYRIAKSQLMPVPMALISLPAHSMFCPSLPPASP